MAQMLMLGRPLVLAWWFLQGFSLIYGGVIRVTVCAVEDSRVKDAAEIHSPGDD